MLHLLVGSRAGYVFMPTACLGPGRTYASSFSRHAATGPVVGRSYSCSQRPAWARPTNGWLSYVREGRPAGSMGSIVGSAVPEEPRAVHSSVESEGGMDLVSAVLTAGETL